MTLKATLILAGMLLCIKADAAITDTGDVLPQPVTPRAIIQIANQGIGTLVVDGGSIFDSQFLMIAQGASGIGTAIVRDPGSLWQFIGGEIGNNGVGRLEVRNGATVEVPSPANLLRVGNNPTANGTILVDGRHAQQPGAN
jgi:T5SS/PEP-CTERM-associated repeat protein